MWDWDPGQGEAAGASSTPLLVSSESHQSPIQSQKQEPVVIPDVAGLRQQFQIQQATLAHIKETLLVSDADRTSKEKQLEMYTKKLAQIKNRSKGVKNDSPKKSRSRSREQRNRSRSREHQKKIAEAVVADKSSNVHTKMSELKKCLQENKIKFEERTEKGLAETRKIESMVEQLRTQVQERDISIHELQKNMVTPPARPRPTVQTIPRRYKDRPLILSKWTQTQRVESEESARIKELEAIKIDLEDTIKQQESVIAARTKAITLLSEDLSKKSKSTLNDLEDTRTEMREMQSNFVQAETQLKSQLQEKDERLSDLEKKLVSLEAENTELLKLQAEADPKLKDSENAPVQETTTALADDACILELNKKVVQLEKELDDSNKLMIRLKLEQKQKLKAANKIIEMLKKSSGESEELIRLKTAIAELETVNGKLNEKVAELEEEKGNLQLSLLDFDEFKAAWDVSCKEFEEKLMLNNSEIDSLKERVDSLEREKSELLQNIDDQNILIDNLNSMGQQMISHDIPGDQAAQHFDASNEIALGQMQEIIQEKQMLFEKLKTFSVSDDVAEVGRPEKFSQLQSDLAAEKAKVTSLEEKIASLQKDIASLGTQETDGKGTNALKNKLRNAIAQLKKEKAKNVEMAESLSEKEKLIVGLNEKVSQAERTRRESMSSWGDPDPDVVEIQQKCLSMEGEFLQLNEKYEHLRKENIELTGEKVRRQQALEDETEAARSIGSLQTMADGLEKRIASLEATPAVAQPDLQYASIVIASNDTEIFNLQMALANKTEELETLKEEVTALKTANEDLANELNEEKAAFVGISQKCQGDAKLVEDSRRREAELAAALNMKISECEAYAKEFQSATKAEANMKNDLESVKRAFEARENELKAKTEESRSLQIECQTLKQELHRMQVSIESMMLEGAQQRTTVENLTVQVESLKTQLMEMTLKCEETENVLQKTWAERNELIQSRESILQHLKHFEARVEALTRERDEAGQHAQMISNQLAAVSAQQSVLDGATKELSVKQDELNEMTSKAKKLAANLKKKTQTEKELQEKLQTLSAENADLANRLAVNQGLLDEMNSGKCEKEILLKEQQTYALEKQQLNERNEVITKENRALSETLADMLQLQASFNEQLKVKEAEIHGLSENLLSIQNDLGVSHAEQEKVSNEASSIHAENCSLQQKVLELEGKWATEISEKEKISGVYKQVCQQLKGLEQAFEMEQHENEILLEQKTTSLHEMNKLKCDLDDSKVKLKDLEAERASLLQKIRQMQDEEIIGQLQAERDNLVGELGNVHQSLAEANNKISKLEGDLISVLGEKEQLLEALSNGQKELVAAKTEKENFVRSIEEANQAIAALNISIASLEREKGSALEALQEAQGKSGQEMSVHISEIAGLRKQVQNFELAFDAEVEKNSILKSEIESLREEIRVLEQRLAETPKKKKSVQFSGEAAYIKELRGEVTSLHQALAESDNTVGVLKAALSKEKNDQEQVTRSFDAGHLLQPPTGDFLTESADPADPFSEDSLQWDDSWGAEGQLEAEHMSTKSQDSEKLVKMENEVKALNAEKEQVNEELRVLQVKYSKVVKKLKEQKLQIDQLQANLKTAKSTTGFGDLDVALLDEMKSEMKKAESDKAEIQKELAAVNKEKDALLKQVDMLNAGNDRFIELKERQDTEAAIWQARNAELREQLAQLEAQLLNPPDDKVLAQENSELKNLIEGLEWKVSELTEMIEEKEENLTKLKIQLPADDSQSSNITKEMEELVISSQGALREANEKLADSESQLTMLVAENYALQRILNEQKVSEMPVLEEVKPAPSNLAQWFMPDTAQTDASLLNEIKLLKDELNYKNQEIEKTKGELRDAISAADLEKSKLSLMLEEKEKEVEILKRKLYSINGLYEESKINIERLLAEIPLNAPAEELRLRDEEILALQTKVDQLQKAYEESKIEIDRLLAEDRLGSITLLEDDRVQSEEFETERARYEAMIAMRDSEIEKMRQPFTTFSADQAASHDQCRESLEGLKEQHRQWETRMTQELEQKELEARALRAETAELRARLEGKHAEVEQLRTDLFNFEEEVIAREGQQSNVDAQAFEQRYALLQDEYYKAVQYLDDKTTEIAKIQPLLDQRDAELLATRQELKALQQRLLSRESEITHEHADLESELLARDAEVRELRAERIDMDSECRELRATVEQLQRQKTTAKGITGETKLPGKRPDYDELSSRLQSDLDTALYTLHQRDVRCDELTFELMQLLEERDTLQLRLSNAIRENEHLKKRGTEQPDNAQAAPSQQGHLSDKITQLHNVGYLRDKNVQDERQQRHKEQMALISRQGNSNVMDV